MVSTFEKLGKETKDLFEEHYNIGQVKIDVKNKISNDLGFDFNGCCNTAEEGKVTSSLETKYDLSSYGVQSNIKWTTDNELISEFVISDSSALLEGLKLSFITKNSMGGESKKSGAVKASLESGSYNVTGNLEFEGDSPKLNSSGVYKWNDLLVGLQGQIDVKGHKISGQSIALGWGQGDMQMSANYNFKEANISAFKQISAGMQRGIRLNFTEGQSKLSFAVQQTMDGSSTIKAKINNDGQVGLAYVYQYKPGVKISISSLVEAKNLFTGGHKIGLGINFEA